MLSIYPQGKLRSQLKKANVFLIHKKWDKQILQGCRPVSLLPIWGKVLERLVYNNVLKHLIDNNISSGNQSAFKPADSCISQLLSIINLMTF